MKKRKIRLMLVTLAATISMLSGCGKAGEEAMQETNSLNENGDNENTPQNEDAEEEKDSNTETKNADLKQKMASRTAANRRRNRFQKTQKSWREWCRVSERAL